MRTWLSMVAESPEAAEAPASKPAKWEKPIPLSFSIEYTLVSDYAWRGLNLSEYRGEGREKPNHQLGFGFEVDLEKSTGAPVGAVGGSFWFEWYAGQDDTAFGGGEHHLQEVDYTVYWSYAIPRTPLGVELGWIAYQFPFVEGDDPQWTHEAYGKLSFDDSCLFGRPVLSPTATVYLDLDDVRATWITLGVSHEFALAELGCEDMPVLKDMTVTPSLTLGIDHRFYDKLGVGASSATGTRLGHLEYGLEVGYDLSAALGIPEQYGSLALTGFLNYSQSLHDVDYTASDWLYGGVKVAWSW